MRSEDRGKGMKTERYDFGAKSWVDASTDFWRCLVGGSCVVGRRGQDTPSWKLRVDWSSLPPISHLANEISSAMARCDPKFGARTFQHLGGGLGMNLHTWVQALCAAMDEDKILFTQNPWPWMDEKICTGEEHPMLCYFGAHLPEGSCDRRSFNETSTFLGPDFERCPRYMNAKRTVHDFMAAAMEYLFQSVSPAVIAEAERQARSAFPEGLPDPDDMVTGDALSLLLNSGLSHISYAVLLNVAVHMRWGDKPGEVGEKKTPAEYFVAGVERLIRMNGRDSSSVNVYLASEDEVAIKAFTPLAQRAKGGYLG